MTKFPSCKLVCNFKIYPICFGFHPHLENYIKKVFTITFSYLKTWPKWDELIKKSLTQK